MVTMNQPNDPAGSGQSEGMGAQAKEAGQHMASVAKDEAGRVVGEAGRQVRDMLDRTRSEVVDQAGTQQERLASGLRSASDELSSMGDSVEEPGMATQLVRAAGERTRAIAEWLEERDPTSLMEEARAYARRRPGMFLAIAAAAGIAVGRITRAAVGTASESGAGDTGRDYPTPRSVADVPGSSDRTGAGMGDVPPTMMGDVAP